jgi:hypothetical protein
MTTSFTDYVDEWDKLAGKIAELKKQLKPLESKELEMRKAIRDSVRQAMGVDFKEGMNNYLLPDLRTLKVNHKVTRSVDEASIPAAREEYRKLNDVPCTFDDLLRVKYEIEKKQVDKLEGDAAKIFANVYTTKDASPEVKLS